MASKAQRKDPDHREAVRSTHKVSVHRKFIPHRHSRAMLRQLIQVHYTAG